MQSAKLQLTGQEQFEYLELSGQEGGTVGVMGVVTVVTEGVVDCVEGVVAT